MKSDMYSVPWYMQHDWLAQFGVNQIVDKNVHEY